MAKQITEAGPLGTVKETKSGRLQIGLITPGWGSSGYYSDKVLENAAAAKVFPAGTQMFLDHPGEAERYDRPERSVKDLAAVLTEDATWDPSNGLVGEAQVFGPWVELLTDEAFAAAVGVSIRASADTTVGEAEGRKGTIITELVEAKSVDFVTKAGRGGRILAVLESARPQQVVDRAIAHGVAEATANDTRDALNDAIKAAYGSDQTWLWVRDFDETTVWFDRETPDEQVVMQQGYILDGDGGVELAAGDPIEVRAHIQYVPVSTSSESITIRINSDLDAAAIGREVEETLARYRATNNVPAPAGRPTPTPTSEEDTMGTIQVDEAEHGRITEAAGRVPTLESERDQAITERDQARQELATERRTTAANRVIDAAEADFTPLERRGLLSELPVTEAGDLDEDAFTTTVTEAAAARAEADGAGSVRGFGSTQHTDTSVIVEAEKAAAGAFGREIKEA
jgi:hypothetical protein